MIGKSAILLDDPHPLHRRVDTELQKDDIYWMFELSNGLASPQLSFWDRLYSHEH